MYLDLESDYGLHITIIFSCSNPVKVYGKGAARVRGRAAATRPKRHVGYGSGRRMRLSRTAARIFITATAETSVPAGSYLLHGGHPTYRDMRRSAGK